MRLKFNPLAVGTKEWIQATEGADLNRLAETIIPDCIDEAIFYLLDAIDNKNLKLTFTTPDGQEVDLSVEGLSELAGWYAGSDSWRARFSQEKVNDSLTDLNLDGDAT